MSFADRGATITNAHHRRQDRRAGLQRRVAEDVLQELLPDEGCSHQGAEDDDAGTRRDPEDAPRRNREVVERELHSALAEDETRDRSGRPPRRARPPGPPFPAPARS